LPGLRLIGSPKAARPPPCPSLLDDIHPHDLGTILDRYGIAIRAGHHCAQPVMKHFGVPGTARISLAFYNKREEIDALASRLMEAKKVFKP
jgi:cysteine desulfurase/selenocysteine lyase